MDRGGGADPDKTIIKPRAPRQQDPDKTLIVARQKKAAPAEPTKPIASPAPMPSPGMSTPRIVALSLVAFLFLGGTAALVTVSLMTGRQTDMVEANLDQTLVPVEPQAPEQGQEEPAETPEILSPRIIGLSGDPIIMTRHQSISRKLEKLGSAAITAAASVGVQGEVYRLSDTLRSAEGALTAALPGSQQSYAFFAGAGGSAVDAGVAADDNTSVIETSDTASSSQPSRLELQERIEEPAPISKMLIEWGFREEDAKKLEESFADTLNLRSFAKDDRIAVRGFLPGPGDTLFVPAQISIYRDQRYLGTLGLSDKGTYVPAEDPWTSEEVLAQTEQALSPTAKLRLLDSIYATLMRNSLPTSVAGEIILLLSRAADLDQTADEDDRILVVYSNAPRDHGTGLGRVLFVRVERSAGNIECYAFQPKSGAQFECVSGDGGGTEIGGMVTPVKGVITAKYGPRPDPKTHQSSMNFGVNWAAPAGTAVVAAFDGEVVFAGENNDFGNFVKIAHGGDRATGYAYLRGFASGIAAGVKVEAGQTIGYVGDGGPGGQPELHFELYQGGRPIDPFGQYQQTIEKGGAIEALVHRITYIESGHNCKAANPLSTAVGLGQFIESTWMNTVRAHRPDLLQGRTRMEVLALRLDCDIALEMTTAFTRDNAAAIRANGFAATPGSLYLAHFLGVGGAVKALGAPSGAPVGQVVGYGVVKANPFLNGYSAADLIAWAARKMNQKAPVVSVQNAPAAPPKAVIKYAANQAFLAMKAAVDTLLQ
ncbi:MAG: M23 family metallopeptidase [Hyphomicrobiales bacterium]